MFKPKWSHGPCINTSLFSQLKTRIYIYAETDKQFSCDLDNENVASSHRANAVAKLTECIVRRLVSVTNRLFVWAINEHYRINDHKTTAEIGGHASWLLVCVNYVFVLHTVRLGVLLHWWWDRKRDQSDHSHRTVHGRLSRVYACIVAYLGL